MGDLNKKISTVKCLSYVEAEKITVNVKMCNALYCLADRPTDKQNIE